MMAAPNATLVPEPATETLALVAARAIVPGEAVTIRYASRGSAALGVGA